MGGLLLNHFEYWISNLGFVQVLSFHFQVLVLIIIWWYEGFSFRDALGLVSPSEERHGWGTCVGGLETCVGQWWVSENSTFPWLNVRLGLVLFGADFDVLSSDDLSNWANTWQLLIKLKNVFALSYYSNVLFELIPLDLIFKSVMNLLESCYPIILCYHPLKPVLMMLVDYLQLLKVFWTMGGDLVRVHMPTVSFWVVFIWVAVLRRVNVCR